MLVKRLFDFFFSALGLLLVSPVCLVIAILIKLRMPGPVIFSQKRIGRNGKLFTIYKFRTMVVNHEGSTVSVKGESRITPFGSKLRKYKLDELPELWNILKGDMSFVGPRPDVPAFINRLTMEEKFILEHSPGLTSPASLKYANEEEIVAAAFNSQEYYETVIWPDKVRMNLEYCRTRTFIGDIIIIFKTLFYRGC